jgi:multimeric flavodoxin WrbA
MKVVGVLGSPRKKGITTVLAENFFEKARSSGAELELFTLNSLVYRGCQGCMACKGKRESCILADDMTPVLESVKEADVLVMTTPIYFGEVSSQLKGFIDRTFSYLVPGFFSHPEPCRLKPGKDLVFIISQGAENEDMFNDVYPRYASFFKWFGFAMHQVRACGLDTGDDLASDHAIFDILTSTFESVKAKHALR